VCNPNAPTGSFISIDELASLADDLAGVLLVDEAYVDFAPDNATRLVSEFDNVIVLRSMSKGYGLAGLRFGYAIASADMMAGLFKTKDSYNVDTVGVVLATAAIKDQQYFKENVKTAKTERARLAEQLRALGFAVPKSAANFLLVQSRNRKASEIYEMLVQRGIYVRYFDLPGLDNKLRITVGTKDQNDKLILALREILSQ
jgi:histidinol-phosphate aminotransferase